MSRLVIASIGPASSVQDGGRHGAQRYGLTVSGAMDRLSLAAANTLVGNEPFAAAVEVGPFGASFTARDGAVRVAISGAPRNADVAGSPVAMDTSVTLKDGETLTLGFARGGAFAYLAIESGIKAVRAIELRAPTRQRRVQQTRRTRHVRQAQELPRRLIDPFERRNEAVDLHGPACAPLTARLPGSGDP
jgi:allophanate hydrolase subunit 2